MTEKHPDDPNRKPDGTFAEGNNANPEGNNGHLEGWQRYGTRLQRWLLKNGEEIAKEFEDDGKSLMKRPVIDIACIQHAKDMITGEPETRQRAREAAIDRIDGKPKQTVAHGGDPDNPTPISMDGVFTLTFGTEDNDGSDTGKPETPQA